MLPTPSLAVRFAPASLPREGALVLLYPQGGEPAAAHQVDEATGGQLSRAIAAQTFTGKAGKTLTLLAPGSYTKVVVVGTGPAAEFTPAKAEEAAGHAVAALASEPHAAIDAAGLDAAHAAALATGATLRAYRFDRYRTTETADDKPRLAKLTILADAPDAATAAFDPALPGAVFLARDLASEPANVLYPATFAQRCEELRDLGLEVTVLDRRALEKGEFRLLLGVEQGSVREARVVTMRWNGGGDDKPIALIGKGVTFDSGGISIKPAGGMEDMKWDMAGAGAVTGAMAAIAGRKARANVVGVIGLTENMPSGSAQRPGDVVRSKSGLTVEVINTDAEGRLVLADVLTYVHETFAPRLMVDLATLTGAIIIGLGHEHAGLFANDDELAAALTRAGAEVGEKLWRMPLHDNYDKQLKSEIADMKNVGGRPAGASTGAQFVQRFVPKGMPWAHLDIAGMAWTDKDHPTVPKGATAFGVRLLDRFVRMHEAG